MRNFILLSLLISVSSNASLYVPPGSISTAKIADGAVTHVKQGALGQQSTGAISFGPGTSTSYADITGATVTITTTGRPVMIFFSGPTTGNCLASFDSPVGTGGGASGFIQMLRGATVIGQHLASNAVSAAATDLIRLYLPCSAFLWFDNQAAGTYTYKAQYKVSSGTSFGLSGIMTAFEL